MAGAGNPGVDHGREPCPDRILDDIGGAFGMGAVGAPQWLKCRHASRVVCLDLVVRLGFMWDAKGPVLGRRRLVASVQGRPQLAQQCALPGRIRGERPLFGAAWSAACVPFCIMAQVACAARRLCEEKRPESAVVSLSGAACSPPLTALWWLCGARCAAFGGPVGAATYCRSGGAGCSKALSPAELSLRVFELLCLVGPHCHTIHCAHVLRAPYCCLLWLLPSARERLGMVASLRRRTPGTPSQQAP